MSTDNRLILMKQIVEAEARLEELKREYAEISAQRAKWLEELRQPAGKATTS